MVISQWKFFKKKYIYFGRTKKNTIFVLLMWVTLLKTRMSVLLF